LGGGEACIAQAHQQRDEGGGAQAAAQVFNRDARRHQQHVLAADRDQPEAQVGHGLQQAEHHQTPIQTPFRQNGAACERAENGSNQTYHFVDRADLGGGIARAANQEGGGQAACKRVAQFIENDQRQQRQCPFAGEELGERAGDSLGQRTGCTGDVVGLGRP